MSVKISIKKSGGGNFELFGATKIYTLKHRLKEALDDISEEIRENASRRAPISDPDDKAGGSARHIPSGTLKENPVDIFHSGMGESISVGRSGFRFQAPAGATDLEGNKIGGQFISSRSSPLGEAHIFYTIDIEYPSYPFYAKFVAFGVGGHGPAGDKPMKFRYGGKNFKTRYVSGQKANPWLPGAINDSKGYIELRIGQLKAEARSL
jgi:hypothetical protein